MGSRIAKEASYARNCLLARRLIERGVRFVQLFHEAWDQHSNLTAGVKQNALDTDQASAALVRDLKQRGLLADTLVIWGGEFGRTPMVQGGNDGRDHHNRCFSMWLAGGGCKAGYVHGLTDELGFNVVDDPVHVHDLNATLLHQLGFRPHPTHVPLPGTRLSIDRRAWQRGAGPVGVTPVGHPKLIPFNSQSDGSGKRIHLLEYFDCHLRCSLNVVCEEHLERNLTINGNAAGSDMMGPARPSQYRSDSGKS